MGQTALKTACHVGGGVTTVFRIGFPQGPKCGTCTSVQPIRNVKPMLLAAEEKGRNLDFGSGFQQLGELATGFSAVITKVNGADIVKVFSSGSPRSDNAYRSQPCWRSRR